MQSKHSTNQSINHSTNQINQSINNSNNQINHSINRPIKSVDQLTRALHKKLYLSFLHWVFLRPPCPAGPITGTASYYIIMSLVTCTRKKKNLFFPFVHSLPRGTPIFPGEEHFPLRGQTNTKRRPFLPFVRSFIRFRVPHFFRTNK